MMRITLYVALLASFFAKVSAECANACNGHGRCTSYDMCLCQRNWQGNDCSERVCQFGLAHVDTPKGDLDNSGVVTDATTANRVVENSFVYPYGTTEQYPEMIDSDLNVITESAHYYMECSNKGTCDRKKGTCKCYPGYDGAACQRASCPGFPNSCSGHGVCKTIQQLANADTGNIYELWDRFSTMGCECDAGYHGADCSQRQCKHGVDPLYMDDSATIKYPVWNVATLAHIDTANGDGGAIFYDGMNAGTGTGYWALRFFDSHGEDWLTEPIPGAASCNVVKEALYAIPNNVVPRNTVSCTLVTAAADDINPTAVNEETDDTTLTDYITTRPIIYKFAFWDALASTDKLEAAGTDDGGGGTTSSFDETNNQEVMGYVYRLKFFGNPGALKQPEIEIYLDGDRPTLAAIDNAPAQTEYASKLITKVWTDGMQGENKDYFADHCDGVTAKVLKVDNTAGENLLPQRVINYLGLTQAESNLLKTCLGGADFDGTNNVDSYDWDFGSRKHPHLVKLVRSVTSATDGGHYVALIFKPYDTDITDLAGTADTTGYFEMVNPWRPLDLAEDAADPTDATDYEVYTTKGTLALTSEKADAFFGFAEQEIYTYNIADEATRDAKQDVSAYHFGGLSCELTTTIKYRSQTHTTYDNTNFEKTEFQTGTSATDYICLNKGDIIIPLIIPQDKGVTFAVNDYDNGDAIDDTNDDGNIAADAAVDTLLNRNAPEINLYTVTKIINNEFQLSEKGATVAAGVHGANTQDLLSHWKRNVIHTDISTNWGVGANLEEEDSGTDPAVYVEGFKIYKFYPAAESTYEYVAQCSNRGICDSKTGLCDCFPGYGNDNCDEQNALAL